MSTTIPLTYSYIKEQIEKEVYKLLSNIYTNAHVYLLVQCNKGHKYKVTWNKWQQGRRCPYCAGNKKLTYDYVKKQIESVEGYKLLSKTYIGANNNLLVQCNKGHKYKVTWGNFQQGQRCFICQVENRANKKRHSYEYVKKQIEKEGYKLLSKNYKNSSSKLKIQCDKGHRYKANYNNFQQKNSRCPVCNAEKQSSIPEEEIQKVLKELNIDFIPNNRTQIINPLTGYSMELDIWIPKLNKAIEFNGKYWHSLKEVKIRDIEKYKQCMKKGIDMFIIQERDWLNDKNEVIKQIGEWI